MATAVGVVLFLLALAASVVVGRFDPVVLAEGWPKLGEYVWRTVPQLGWATLGRDLASWYYGLPKWLDLMLETVLIAYLATLLGTIGALALAPLASRNLALGPTSAFLSRRILEFCRTIPDLVFALIFVFAFGLGPLPGVLAIAIHSLGANGKLFTDANENIDMKQCEGLQAAGATWLETLRYAVLPQVLPNYLSYVLWRFEINVRTAAVLGFVGAGGIGTELITAVRSLYYEDISALVILIVVTVSIIDMICGRLRHRLIGKEAT